MSEKQDLVIYHGPGCPDGFCAAWIAWQALGPEAEFVPAQYGDASPDVRGRRVWVLDFSYPREVLERMAVEAANLIVLDHHATAQEALAGLPYVQFDLTCSGAVLTWEYFHPHRDLLALVLYVQDRDLWTNRLPFTREINASIASYPHEFETWSRIAARLEADPFSLEHEGKAILRYQRQVVERLCEHARETVIHGYRVLAVNTPVLVSEVAGKLAEGRLFGAAWFERGDGKRVYSLRSDESGVDVAEVAQAMGGGGHKHAAGFQLDRS